MDNFIERLRKEITEQSMTNNKLWAHVELLYVGPYGAMYLTPARIDHHDRGSDVLRLSNYAVMGRIAVENLRFFLSNARYDINSIKLEIHREEDDKHPDIDIIYLEECKSFFRMDSDTLVLTNIDIESEIKDPFVKLVIDKLIGKETQRLEYSNPRKTFSSRNVIMPNKEEK